MSIINSHMMEQLFSVKDKHVIVTGAGGGIGSVFAKGHAASGAKVILCDIDTDKMNPVIEEINQNGGHAKGFKIDLSNHDSIRSCIGKITEYYSKIDILMNCAAINKREPFLEVEEKTFDKIMQVDLRGLYQISQQVVPLMKKNGGGKIINIGSLNSEIALAGVSVYGAAKGAVKQLTMVMAIELADDNIQVNCIIPGFMNTELSAPVWADSNKSAWMRERIAMKRPGEPEELLGIAMYLSSQASSYSTGQSYVIDGGVLAGGTSW